MRLFVHDFAGHPFQVDLSRELARRGHTVTHASCASLDTTPQGTLARRDDDPETLSFLPIEVPGFNRQSLVRRFVGERAYGRRLAAAIAAAAPDVVLSANTPLDAQAMALRATHAAGGRFVFWLQDLIGEATLRLLRPRLGRLGALVGHHYRRLEGRLLRRSDAVVAITDDFRPMLHALGVPDARIHVVENWAPIADVPVQPQDNPWSRAHSLAGQTVLLYTGTLGMKHNPALLVALAEAMRERPDVHVVVTSQGAGADLLRREAEARGLPRLTVLGFQPFEAMPDVLGSAAVLLAVLEPDAGVFSVPSKVLTYLCAARPLVLAVPDANLAARIVTREGAGVAVDPSDERAFVDAVRAVLNDSHDDAAMGHAARAYAERTFDTGAIADRFEEVLRPAHPATLSTPRPHADA